MNQPNSQLLVDFHEITSLVILILKVITHARIKVTLQAVPSILEIFLSFLIELLCLIIVIDMLFIHSIEVSFSVYDTLITKDFIFFGKQKPIEIGNIIRNSVYLESWINRLSCGKSLCDQIKT